MPFVPEINMTLRFFDSAETALGCIFKMMRPVTITPLPRLVIREMAPKRLATPMAKRSFTFLTIQWLNCSRSDVVDGPTDFDTLTQEWVGTNTGDINSERLFLI